MDFDGRNLVAYHKSRQNPSLQVPVSRLPCHGQSQIIHSQGIATMMALMKEFKEFAMRGNVVDMAVGVIMGTAFGKIVNSIVADVLMPPIGYLVGGVDFKDLSYKLPEKKISIPDVQNPGQMAETTLEAVTINYGNFLQTCFDFVIIAFCVFMVIKLMNTVLKKKAAEPAPAAPPEDVVLLREIRDALKART